MRLPDSAEIKEGKFAFFEDDRKVSKDFWRILISDTSSALLLRIKNEITNSYHIHLSFQAEITTNWTQTTSYELLFTA